MIYFQAKRVLYVTDIDVYKRKSFATGLLSVKTAVMKPLNDAPKQPVQTTNSSAKIRSNASHGISYVTEMPIVMTKVMKWKTAPNARSFGVTTACAFYTRNCVTVIRTTSYSMPIY